MKSKTSPLTRAEWIAAGANAETEKLKRLIVSSSLSVIVISEY
jgi:hypothetical protein